MKLSKCVLGFAITGALVSISLRALWGWVNSSTWASPAAKIVLQKVTVILWPSSVFLLSATSEQRLAIKLFATSTLVNVVLYMLVGVLTWVGLHKHAGFFALLGLSLGAMWWYLLAL